MKAWAAFHIVTGIQLSAIGETEMDVYSGYCSHELGVDTEEDNDFYLRFLQLGYEIREIEITWDGEDEETKSEEAQSKSSGCNVD